MLVAIANDFEWSFKGGYNNCTLSAGGDGAIKLDAARLSCQGRYLPQVLHSSPSSFSLHLSYGLLYVWVSIWLASLTACIITKGFHSPCPACPCNTPVCPSLSLLLILLYSHTLFFSLPPLIPLSFLTHSFLRLSSSLSLLMLSMLKAESKSTWFRMNGSYLSCWQVHPVCMSVVLQRV